MQVSIEGGKQASQSTQNVQHTSQKIAQGIQTLLIWAFND